jgi:CRISP-associated protein Cas1
MKPYYLFNPGRLSRRDNTLKFTPTDKDGNEGMPKYLPVEDVESLYIFGDLDVNSALLNFLGKNRIPTHFFDFHEHYTGSFMPRDYLLAGTVQVAQTRHYLSAKKRLALAQALVEGAAFNMLKNLRYYDNRGKDTSPQIARIEGYLHSLAEAPPPSVEALMGMEGNIRQTYYEAFEAIIQGFEMGARTKQPPSNEINALISYGNMVCYTLCLDTIYHTQLNPTISFLHEPGYRRYSLALDLAEVFKPILVDRLIFTLLNKKQLQAKDFDKQVNSCLLKEPGRKTYMKAWDERLKETIKHRALDKQVSYKRLVRLECYKLTKHLLGIQPYQPFKIWW